MLERMGSLQLLRGKTQLFHRIPRHCSLCRTAHLLGLSQPATLVRASSSAHSLQGEAVSPEASVRPAFVSSVSNSSVASKPEAKPETPRRKFAERVTETGSPGSSPGLAALLL